VRSARRSASQPSTAYRSAIVPSMSNQILIRVTFLSHHYITTDRIRIQATFRRFNRIVTIYFFLFFSKKVLTFSLRCGIILSVGEIRQLLKGATSVARAGLAKTTAFGIRQVRPGSRFLLPKMLRPCYSAKTGRGARPRPAQKKRARITPRPHPPRRPRTGSPGTDRRSGSPDRWRSWWGTHPAPEHRPAKRRTRPARRGCGSASRRRGKWSG